MSSSLNTSALLKAAGIGVALFVGLSLCTTVLNFVQADQLKQPLDPDTASVVGLIGLVAICICVIGLLFYGGIGAAYAFFAQKDGMAMEAGPMALGGALAGLIVAVVHAVLNGLSSLISGSAMVSLPSGLGGDPAAGALMAGSVLVGVLIGACFLLVVGAGLGAAGGAIYAAIAKGREPAAQPPAAV